MKYTLCVSFHVYLANLGCFRGAWFAFGINVVIWYKTILLTISHPFLPSAHTTIVLHQDYIFQNVARTSSVWWGYYEEYGEIGGSALQRNPQYSILMRYSLFFLPAVRRGPDDSTIGSATAVFNTEFDASIMFRMSYGDGLISLEALDESGTSMTHTYSPSPANEVKYIELYSKTTTLTDWTFYKTCATFL